MVSDIVQSGEIIFSQIRDENIPEHVAIIMDGNGRWAKERGLDRIEGHKKGIETTRNIVRAAADLKIKYLTIFAFSIENWRRPETEINALMGILNSSILEELPELIKNDIKISIIGRRDNLSPETRKNIDYAVGKTKNNSGMNLIIALNYSSRAEIIDAIHEIIKEVANNKYELTNINEELFSRHLYTKFVPDPDLLIRTSGEMRISNFLLWQIAYTEIYVTPTLWPDFKVSDFYHAISEYQKRERRFGAISPEME